jgi:hypothetical protein
MIVCHCGIVSQAVLLRSEKILTRMLAANPTRVAETNRLGQTPVHLLADWPAGTQILLEAGTDPNMRDFSDLLPISYACKYNCSGSVLFKLDTKRMSLSPCLCAAEIHI